MSESANLPLLLSFKVILMCHYTGTPSRLVMSRCCPSTGQICKLSVSTFSALHRKIVIGASQTTLLYQGTLLTSFMQHSKPSIQKNKQKERRNIFSIVFRQCYFLSVGTKSLRLCCDETVEDIQLKAIRKMVFKDLFMYLFIHFILNYLLQLIWPPTCKRFWAASNNRENAEKMKKNAKEHL